MTIPMLIGMVFVIIWQDHPRQDIFKLSASAASEFCEWIHVAIDVYIPHCKNQVKPESSTWFLATFTVVTVHRNHFFSLVPTE